MQPFTPLGKIAAALTEAAEQADGDIGRLEEARALALGLDPYIEAMTSPPSAALDLLEQETRSEDWQSRYSSDETSLPLQQTMLSGNLEGQFLATLIAFGSVRRVLEIGLFTGYGALAMAQALPEGGTLTALEIDDYAARFARRHFDRTEHGDKIEIIVAPAQQSLSRLADEGRDFDFVFIDADKPGYADYYETLLSRRLLAPGGLICIDNTLLGGEAYLPAGGDSSARSENGEAIAAFNRMVADDPRTVQVLLPIRDGVTLVRRAG